jgi:hypothetical protein
MILSESEKNRIKGLYGLVTEGDSAPPPDESILVANKNPYKYSEYESARRLYNKNLVDGDMFYIIKRLDGEYGYFGNLSGLYNKISLDVCKDILGKNVRLFEEDKILSIGNDVIIGSDDRIRVLGFELKNTDKWLWVFEDKKCSIDEPRTHGGRLGIPTNLRTNTISRGWGYTGIKVPEKFTSVIVNKIVEIKKITNNLSMDKSESRIVNIPDEYFEIRKIQREKTDF